MINFFNGFTSCQENANLNNVIGNIIRLALYFNDYFLPQDIF